MIERNSVLRIGKVTKTHGIKGEMSADLDVYVDPSDLGCMIFDMDGILVPFFARSARPRGSESWLFMLDGIDSDTEAAEFVGKDIYGKKDDPILDLDEAEDVFYLSDLVGWKIICNNRAIGTVTHIEDSTENVLFVVRDGSTGKELLLPANEEFISEINKDNKTITLDLPEGILELN